MEATVNEAYKKAIVESGMEDIVMTEKLSGTPCTIINTSEAQRMGLRQNRFEKFLSNNPRTKKWFKSLVQLRGFRMLEQSVVPDHYKTLWCAGQSVELINEVLPCSAIIARFKEETQASVNSLFKNFHVE
jgi:nitronate monooxygenase